MYSFIQNIPIDEVLAENIYAYDFCYFGQKTIPAGPGGTDVIPIEITSDADFLCKQITCQYTTLGAGPVDLGACGINVLITDQGRNLKLFNTPIPASLFATPGRQRNPGTAGDPSLPLYEPMEFYYPFLRSSSINVELSNSQNYANEFSICFWGTKYRISREEA